MAVREVIDVGDTREMAMDLAEVLPRRVRAPFTASFVRSARLYDEFIHRLVLSVFRASGLGEAAAGAPSTPDDIMARAGIERGRARAPVEWMLRRLSHRGVLEQTDGDGGPRFRLRAGVPELDPAAVREEQQREDATWMPSYVLAETVAQDYPAFLRGTRTGEEILFSPTRLRLWVDFFSNDNPLYAVNNVVGAGAAWRWNPPGPLAIVELGGGLGSGAAALLEGLRRRGRWPEIREYRFTELIAAFLRRGQQALQTRFPDASFVKFGMLDMNLPFDEAGCSSRERVTRLRREHAARRARPRLHAARDLPDAGAGRPTRLLRVHPHDVRRRSIYVEFIFILMETFRSPVLNPTYRPNGGFLTPEQWRGAMEAAGFVDVALLPDIVAVRSRFPDFIVAAIGATRPA